MELAEIREFTEGEQLIDVGDTDRNLFVVLDGAMVVREDDTIVRVSGEGDCVGELGFIHGTAEKRAVQALSAMRAIVVSADSLSELPPKVHLRFYRHISATLGKRLAVDDDFSVDIEL